MNSMTGREKSDLLIQVTTWAGLIATGSFHEWNIMEIRSL